MRGGVVLGDRLGRDAESVASSYGDLLLDALRRALGAVAFLAFIGLAFTRGLPGRSTAREPAEAALPPPAVDVSA